jgi:DNA polymerase III delta subunit
MLTLLLGPDGFTKKEYIRSLANKEKAEVALFVQPESLDLGQLTGQDLFGAKKVFVLQDAIKLINESNLPQMLETNNQIILVEEKLDKRSTFNKNLLAHKSIAAVEFDLPHGKELNQWITARVKALGGGIQPQAVEMAAVFMGRDDAKETKFGGKVVEVQEIYSLQDVENELQKLLAYADGKEITTDMVEVLIPQRKEADVFAITNCIGENNRQEAYRLLEIFLATENISDEKGKIIQLNALLSEQFRNVAMVQDFTDRRVPEAEILEKTQWKSGRLFVMKKLAGKFSHKKVLDLLNKLNLLDEELKTTSTPPRVLLDLIFSQL